MRRTSPNLQWYTSNTQSLTSFKRDKGWSLTTRLQSHSHKLFSHSTPWQHQRRPTYFTRNEMLVRHSGDTPNICSLRALLTWLQGGERIYLLFLMGRERNSQALNIHSPKGWRPHPHSLLILIGESWLSSQAHSYTGPLSKHWRRVVPGSSNTLNLEAHRVLHVFSFEPNSRTKGEIPLPHIDLFSVNLNSFLS